MSKLFQVEGKPFPLGVSYIKSQDAFNFALFSKHASAVQILFYTEDDCLTPKVSLDLDYLYHKTHDIWHFRLSRDELSGCVYYAYRVWGPHSDQDTKLHNFDPDKLMVDPYAVEVYFPEEYSREIAKFPGKNDGKAPLGVLPPPNKKFAKEKIDKAIFKHFTDIVIYEMHIGHFTKNPNSKVGKGNEGTFQGVIDKIPYLKELGVTCIELMPVHQCDPQEGSVWGYMPMNFFSPERKYASDQSLFGPMEEFKRMVKELHAAGMEVILDVVFNHTSEEGFNGPNYSYKGIDASTYYMWDNQGGKFDYANYTGCGNTLKCSNNVVRSLVLDSLRYWVKEMHVDGFRFDIASIFARNSDGSMNYQEPPIFHEISSDPDMQDIILIAEPWEPGISLLGKNFPGLRWSQWNGKYRDEVKKFIRGDEGLVGNIMNRMYGSCDDLFPDDLINAYRPFQSLNYLASHDGYTLYDCTAYSDDNTDDGHKNSNSSTNYGWEGELSVSQEIMNLRKRQVKNMFTLLMLSNGIPMFRAGDEFLHTQPRPSDIGAEYNPYNIDGESVWLNWNRLEQNHDMFNFFKNMIAFRKAHPTLCRSRFWREDIEWFGPSGYCEMGLESKFLSFYLNGTNEKLLLDDNDLFVMINMQDFPVEFDITKKGNWHCVVNTWLGDGEDILLANPKPYKKSKYLVGDRSIVVLMDIKK